MDFIGEREIRRALDGFLRDNRHGAIQMLVKATGLSRPTISRMANGMKVEQQTLRAVQDGLDSLKYEPPPETETQKDYDVLDSVRSRLLVIVDDMDMADMSRAGKARIALRSLRILVEEHGAKLAEIGNEEE